jgi:CBS domain-containing protein
MLVEQILPATRERLVTIRDNSPLVDAAKVLNRRDANLVVVCNSDGVMLGVITKTDIVTQISRCQGARCTMATAAVMTREVTFCQSHEFLSDIWSTMKERGLKQ